MFCPVNMIFLYPLLKFMCTEFDAPVPQELSSRKKGGNCLNRQECFKRQKRLLVHLDDSTIIHGDDILSQIELNFSLKNKAYYFS